MGEVIFRELTEREGIGDRFEVSSHGTGAWHVGNPADPRTLAALAKAGYDGSKHRAAQLAKSDIARTDLLVALAREHETHMLDLGAAPDQVTLLTPFDPDSPADPDVFDPYFSEQHAFDEVLHQVARSCARLLAHLAPQLP